MKRGFNITDQVKVIEEVKPMIRSLDSLQNLTHLLLFGIGEEVTFTVFSLVGKSCPKLNHLTVEKYSMWAKPLLALIFGELLNDLADFNNEAESSWWRDDALTNLVVPIEFLTPICSSLRFTRLRNEVANTGSEWRVKKPLNEATVTFRDLFLRGI